MNLNHEALVPCNDPLCSYCLYRYGIDRPQVQPVSKPLFSDDYDERKAIPIFTGLLDYFPSALIEVAKVSQRGNDQHNKGEELHWARGKSMNQVDTALRHQMDARYEHKDKDGEYHLAKAAWRILAELQLLRESEGAPKARGAR